MNILPTVVAHVGGGEQVHRSVAFAENHAVVDVALGQRGVDCDVEA
jgi:hypothetical protein